MVNMHLGIPIIPDTSYAQIYSASRQLCKCTGSGWLIVSKGVCVNKVSYSKNIYISSLDTLKVNTRTH